jgi:hypothetical protein
MLKFKEYIKENTLDDPVIIQHKNLHGEEWEKTKKKFQENFNEHAENVANSPKSVESINNYGAFPKAFKSREHFQKEYDKAPLRHMTRGEINNLGNSHLPSIAMDRRDTNHKEQVVRNIIGKRRDVTRILHDIHHGKTAPPIILKHKNGLHLMAGNTRLIAGAAHNINIPAKIIHVKE